MAEQKASMNNKTVAVYISSTNHYSLLNILLASLRRLGCKVMLFIPEEMQKHIEVSSSYPVTFIDNRKFTPSQVFRQLNQADFRIIDQLYSMRELISFALTNTRNPNLLIVHDCNSWFKPQKPERMVNKVKNWLTAKVKNQFRYFAVAGENMHSYLQHQLKIQRSIVVPFRYADFDEARDLSEEPYNPHSKLIVCVPGMVSQRRRYESLIENVTVDSLKGKVELVLLGKPVGKYGEKIIELVKTKNSEGFDIKFWTAFIPTEIFDAEIKRAHLLFSEFDPQYITDNGQVETYGVSKETGISLLMLNKAKVGLLPAGFQQMKTIVGQTLTYSDLGELPQLLESIYQGEINLTALSRQAIQNAQDMNISRVSDAIARAYHSQTQ